MNRRIPSQSSTAIIFATVLLFGALFGASSAFASDVATRSVSPFGACSHMLWGYSTSEIDREMDALQTVGAKWLRVDVSWRDVETSDDSYNASVLRSLDYVVSSASARGIGVQAVVIEFPDWANRGKGMWAPPADDAKFGEFMHYIASRYAGRITYWELANEVNETDFWAVPRASSPARYAAFLKAGYAGVKAGNPSAKVISAGLAGSDYNYLQEMYDAGAGDSFDLLGVHPYTRGRSPYAVDANTPSSTFDGLAIMKSTMDRNGDAGKKIWATEVGWQTSSVGKFVSLDQQGEYVFDAYKRIYEEFPYVETLFCYSLRNGGTSSSSSVDNYGLLNRDYSQKPAFAAYRRAADAFSTQSAAPAPAPAITIRISKPTIKKSRRVALKGTVSTSIGSKVKLQQRVHGTWRNVKTVAADGSGRYSAKVKPKSRGTKRYRAVLVRGGSASAKSRVVRVRVR